jgi:hypothetical protein
MLTIHFDIVTRSDGSCPKSKWRQHPLGAFFIRICGTIWRNGSLAFETIWRDRSLAFGSIWRNGSLFIWGRDPFLQIVLNAKIHFPRSFQMQEIHSSRSFQIFFFMKQSAKGRCRHSDLRHDLFVYVTISKHYFVHIHKWGELSAPLWKRPKSKQNTPEKKVSPIPSGRPFSLECFARILVVLTMERSITNNRLKYMNEK